MGYLILDIESVADGRLIQKTEYSNQPNLSPQESIKLYKKKLFKDSNKETSPSEEDLEKVFIPYTFQVPISMALIKTNQHCEIENITTLDRDYFRPHKITEMFWKGYESYSKKQPLTLVTFNGRSFDLPLMELSAFRYGINAYHWFSGEQTYNKPRYRYTEKYHLDLQELMTNFGATRFHGGLNLLATLLGKPGKMETKGSQVQKLWEEDKKKTIDNYCLCDTIDTYFIFLRSQVLVGKISLEHEISLVKKAHDYLQNLTNEFPILKDYLSNFTFWEKPSDEQTGFMI